MEMDNKDRRQSGLPYICDADMLSDQSKCRKKLEQFNSCGFDERETQERILRDIFGGLGANPWINAPFRCDYGYNISIGDNFICNYNCVILDVTDVCIGNNVQIGPNVTISAAGHPIHPKTRATQFEYGRPIKIGNDVWIGAGAIIIPGITIGDGAVIGAGSVVTRDIPANVVAVGNPCRVLREITDKDENTYYKGQAFDIDISSV